jgi:DNA mismatch repair protein MutS2
MCAQRFSEGEEVYIISLKKGGTVQSIVGADRYRVAIGSFTMTCNSSDLRKPPSKKVPSAPRPIPLLQSSRPPQSIDLHGLAVDEAVRKLDSWLNSVILSELTHVKVVHGLGTGRVQRAVHERLHTLKAVKRFSINQWNTGETDVYL